MRSAIFVILFFCCLTGKSQEHYFDHRSGNVDYSQPFIGESDGAIYIPAEIPDTLHEPHSYEITFNVYTLLKIDDSYYPLFVTILAEKEDGKREPFRYSPNKGNMSLDELRSSVGEQVVIRYKRYAGQLVATKIESIK